MKPDTRAQSANLLLMLLAAAALLGLVLAPPAHAGTYKLYTCNVPGRLTPVPSTAPWTAKLDGVNTYAFDECAVGGAFGIGLNVKMMSAFAEAMLALERPAEGPKSSIGIVRYRTWITAELAGAGAPAFVDVGGACGPPGCVTADADPWVSVPYSQSNPSVSIRLRCTAGDCAFNSNRPLQVRGVEADLYEDVAPAGEIEGGTLLGHGASAGPRTLSISATDQESGVAQVEALLGDTVVANHDLKSNPAICAYSDLNACAARYATDLAIDTSRVAPGVYDVALRITDAAGNRRVVTAGRPVTIGGPASTAGGGARLEASFGRSRTTATTNYGHAVRVRGRLVGLTGQPIARARIAITEIAAQSSRAVKALVVTGADGKFVYTVSGKRPSRSIRLEYAVAGAPSASRRLRLTVRAASTLRLSLRGVTVRYSGRVLSRPIPRRGTKVFIQGRAAGGTWQRFAVRRTDRRGRFSGTYRLRVRRPGVRLQFRVEVPKQQAYPFAARVGAAVTRVVR